MREEEEDLLQFAIQQSLLEAGSEYDQVGPRREAEENRSLTAAAKWQEGCGFDSQPGPFYGTFACSPCVCWVPSKVTTAC